MIDTLRAPATREEVTTLKPSEALRLGRLIAPSGVRGELYSFEGDRLVGACALGAISIGYGVTPDPAHVHGFWSNDRLIKTKIYPMCACYGDLSRPARAFIAHVFDAHTMGDRVPYISEAELVAHLEAHGL